MPCAIEAREVRRRSSGKDADRDELVVTGDCEVIFVEKLTGKTGKVSFGPSREGMVATPGSAWGLALIGKRFSKDTPLRNREVITVQTPRKGPKQIRIKNINY